MSDTSAIGGRAPARRIVLATSNGTGMGHLARQAAVALALRDTVDAEPLVFSLSQAVHVVTRHGLRAEYCPSHHRHWMPHLSWHGYLAARVGALLAETGADTFVFDGVAPYLGLLRARAAHPDVAFVWVRRGMWRPGANRRALAAEPFFDLVVEPGDLAAEADRGATARRPNAVRVPPISVWPRSRPLPRPEAAAALGLDPERPTALVTLGAGSINDAVTPARAAIRTFLDRPDWQVAVTRAPLARSGLLPAEAGRVHELVGVYPLARYLAAFDVAVSAAGYNAVHELLPAGVPTVLVPNAATATDDQLTRAAAVARDGLAVLAADDTAPAVAAACALLLEPSRRAELALACARLPAPTGDLATAERLHDLGGFTGHRAGRAERLRAFDLEARAGVMRALGPAGTSAVRRALGRLPVPGPTRPLAVRPSVTDRLDPAQLRGDHPVEHVLPDSSPAYRARRLEIARDVYRWPAEAQPCDEPSDPDERRPVSDHA
ncbi:glycosyltransferase [Actinopolymorpha sp. NPDC004070]|uniref:glycosyltransferase n=1 Tax=Actinopolymorpha sp. NPDC004070 TaxID=3154548 RepID=UPI00339FBEF8